jgi:hypothetical protein
MSYEHHDHPTPDRLAAFAAGNIDKQERNTLLAHLYECEFCRDCVSLACEDVCIKPINRRKQNRHQGYIRAAAAIAVCLIGVYSNHQGGRQSTPAAALPELALTAPSEKSAAFGNLQFSTVALREVSMNWKVNLLSQRPSQSQIVVQSNYGERWLSFDPMLAIPETAQPTGTVN